MASENFSEALKLVLKHEGGYTNHPSDPGGPTNLGITLANFRRYVKPDGTIADLKKLTKEQAAVCYRRQYWDAVLGAELPSGVDYAVFDFAVNSGPYRAATYLQRIVGAVQDGKIGPATLKAVRARKPDVLAAQLCDARLAFVRGLRTWPVFGKGWGRRIAEVRAVSQRMASQKAAA